MGVSQVPDFICPKQWVPVSFSDFNSCSFYMFWNRVNRNFIRIVLEVKFRFEDFIVGNNLSLLIPFCFPGLDGNDLRKHHFYREPQGKTGPD